MVRKRYTTPLYLLLPLTRKEITSTEPWKLTDIQQQIDASTIIVIVRGYMDGGLQGGSGMYNRIDVIQSSDDRILEFKEFPQLCRLCEKSRKATVGRIVPKWPHTIPTAPRICSL